MHLIALDLEGVLVPEIWQKFADKKSISELNLTTRDEPDYDKLMQHRFNIIKKFGIKYSDILATIEKIEPLTGAIHFLNQLRSKYQVIILSDTFEEFAKPLISKLNYPTIFCHRLLIKNDKLLGYRLRQSNQKYNAVKAFQALNYQVIAAGDSYNDIDMLINADQGYFINALASLKKEYPTIPAVDSYDSLLQNIDKFTQAS